MTFINPDFLLHSETARRLYDEYAAPQPIIDYHSHLPPKDIAENRRFANLFEIWLEGDHYKWRAMRANGVDGALLHRRRDALREVPAWARDRAAHACAIRSITGRTSSWRATSGSTSCSTRRPRRDIWERANDAAGDRRALRAHGILEEVQGQGALHHRRSGRRPRLARRDRRVAGSRRAVYPTFRPDRALDVDAPDVFNAWVDRLAATADVDIARLRTTSSTRCAQRHQALPRRRRPALRPRPAVLLRRSVHRRRSRGDLRPRAQRARRRRPSEHARSRRT